MKDIKPSKLGNVDYIPNNRNLCSFCIYWDECPYNYTCPSLERLINFEMENGEL